MLKQVFDFLKQTTIMSENRYDEVRAMQERYLKMLRDEVKPLDDIAGKLTDEQKEMYDEQRRTEKKETSLNNL